VTDRPPPPALRLYAAVTALVEPLAPFLLRRRAQRGKEDPDRLAERLGHASQDRPSGGLIWLHGASVGEALSLLALIEVLREARPDLAVLVTSGTRTSAEMMARRLPADVIHQFAPIDTPRAAARFLDHWRPLAAVFVESELWPNLLTAAKARGVRLALLSAKLSDRSFRGWSRLRGSADRLWGGFDLLLAQDERSFRRLSALGAKPSGYADLKFGAAPLPADEARLNDLRSRIGGRPLILAASTHPGEDALILDRFAHAIDTHARVARKPLLVIAPRHPERGPAIAEICESEGFSVTRQGAGEAIDDSMAHVADVMGELGLWYRLADLSVICGSLIPGVGGHNPLEPARLGRPFVSGPHVENWRTAYVGLAEAGGVRMVSNPEALERVLREAIDGNDALAGMAARARDYVAVQDEAARAAPARVLAMLR
jgi:3-deoxy-D-manno-octulosonic-acid transferase